MAAFTLRQLGQRTPLVKAGFYSSALGARRALKRLGFDTLEAALDDRCPRIAPAMALPGDVLGFRTDEEHADWIALGVALGNGRALTFHGEPSVGTVLALHEPAALAWRAV